MILIVIAADRDRVNARLESMGYGPGTFACPLSVDGSLPPTHFACEWQALTPEIEALIQAADITIARGRLDVVAQSLELTRCVPPRPGEWSGKTRAEYAALRDAWGVDTTRLEQTATDRVGGR